MLEYFLVMVVANGLYGGIDITSEYIGVGDTGKLLCETTAMRVETYEYVVDAFCIPKVM
jgi:hypothetical protein